MTTYTFLIYRFPDLSIKNKNNWITDPMYCLTWQLLGLRAKQHMLCSRNFDPVIMTIHLKFEVAG